MASALLAQTVSRQAEGAPDEDVLIRSTQAEIAHLAGTSRESASRFLATLERAGIVTLGRGKVTVHDPDDSGTTSTDRERAWSSASCAGAGSTTSGCSPRWRRCRASCSFRGPAPARLPRRRGADRRGPDDVAALDRGLHGPAARARRRRRARARGGHRLGLRGRRAVAALPRGGHDRALREPRRQAPSRRSRARLRQRRGARGRRQRSARPTARRSAASRSPPPRATSRRPRSSSSSRRAPRSSARSSAAGASS